MLNWLDHNIWVLAAVVFIIGVRSLLRGNKQWRSGTGGWEGNPPRWVTKSYERVNWFTVGANIHGLMLIAVSIVMALIMYWER